MQEAATRIEQRGRGTVTIEIEEETLRDTGVEVEWPPTEGARDNITPGHGPLT